MSEGVDYPITITLQAINETSKTLSEVAAKLQEISDKQKEGGGGEKHEGFRQRFESILHIGELIGEAGERLFEWGEKAKEFVEHTIEAGTELGRLSKRTEVSVDVLQQWHYAAGQSGVKAEEFDSALDQLNRRVGQAKAGAGPLLGLLKRVGPAFASQIKHVKGNAEALDLLTKAFEITKDPQQRAALAQAAFGKGTKDMSDFLAQGADKIKALREEAEKLGGSPEVFVHNSEEAEKAINRMSFAFDAAKNQLVAEFLPAITPVFEDLTKLIVENKEELKGWGTEVAGGIESWEKGGGLRAVKEDLQAIWALLKGVGSAVHFVGEKLGQAASIVASGGTDEELAAMQENGALTGEARSRNLNARIQNTSDVFKGQLAIRQSSALVDAAIRRSTEQQLGTAAISVDFTGVPKGTRVKSESDGVSLDTTIGYNMGTP